MQIKCLPVESSNISEIGYRRSMGTGVSVLRVKFRRDGKVYDYTGVSSEEALDLLFADSHGSHLRTYIIPNYLGVVVEGAS